MFAFVRHSVRRRVKRREFFYLSSENILGMDVVEAELVLRARGRRRREKALLAMASGLRDIGARQVFIRDDFIMREELLNLGFSEPDGGELGFALAEEQVLWACGGSRERTIAFYADNLGNEEIRLLTGLAEMFRHVMAGVDRGGGAVDLLARKLGAAIDMCPSVRKLGEADCAVMAEGGRVTVLDGNGSSLGSPEYELRGMTGRDVPPGYDRDAVVSAALRTGKLRREMLRYLPPNVKK